MQINGKPFACSQCGGTGGGGGGTGGKPTKKPTQKPKPKPKSPLVAHYSLNGHIKDSSSNARHGKWVGSPAYAEGGARFNGKSRIEVAAFKKFNWGDKFSVGVWFKRTGQTGNYQVCQRSGIHYFCFCANQFSHTAGHCEQWLLRVRII